MKVLGYNGAVEGYLAAFGTGHDSSAALVVDGEVVAAVEEERPLPTSHAVHHLTTASFLSSEASPQTDETCRGLR
jgi:predicted NodU family carbamoyl transferase